MKQKHTYMVFSNMNNKIFGDSIYTGKIDTAEAEEDQSNL